MSSQKNYIFSHDPVLFLTFDGDLVNEVSHVSDTIPESILDESGYENNASVTNGSTVTKSYRLGMDPLSTIDVIDTHAVCVGFYGRTPTDTELYPKCIFSVPHKEQYEFNDINQTGSFTVSFMYQKDSDESEFRNYMYSVQSTASPQNYDLARPIIQKANVFDITYQDRSYVQDEIRFSTPGGSGAQVVPSWFYQKKNLITLIQDVKKQTNDSYIGTMKFMVNGRVEYSNQYTYTTLGLVPSAQTPSVIEIGGSTIARDTVLRSYSDRQTSLCYFDQIAVFSKALTIDEVAAIQKKTHSYPMLCQLNQAALFYRFNDLYTSTYNTLVDYIGNYNGTVNGSVKSSTTGPERVYSAASMEFYGGSARVNRVSPSSGWQIPPFTITGSQTIDGQFKVTNATRSTLLSIQAINQDFDGLSIELNRRNSQDYPGAIQASNTESQQVSSMQFDSLNVPYNFCDGIQHHIAVVKDGTVLQLWVDGILHGTKTGVPEIVYDSHEPFQIQLMDSIPGNMATTGQISNFGFYNKALQPQEIRQRNNYNSAQFITGNVTLQGNPYQATIRAYDHLTGDLINDTVSEAETGQYTMYFFDNRYIDLMAMNGQDTNIRYRVYGPITVTGVTDLPLVV